MERADKTYMRMVETNRQRSEEKKGYAIATIRKMVSEDKEVTISALIKTTGLSRSFFYNNDDVRREVARAKDEQRGKDFNSGKRMVFNKAMLGKVRIIEAELEKKKNECDTLQKENEKLRRTIRENNMTTYQQL